MSSPKKPPNQLVRMRFGFADGTEVWSAPVTRDEAEIYYYESLYLIDPQWEGHRPVSIVIQRWVAD